MRYVEFAVWYMAEAFAILCESKNREFFCSRSCRPPWPEQSCAAYPDTILWTGCMEPCFSIRSPAGLRHAALPRLCSECRTAQNLRLNMSLFASFGLSGKVRHYSSLPQYVTFTRLHVIFASVCLSGKVRHYSSPAQYVTFTRLRKIKITIKLTILQIFY